MLAAIWLSAGRSEKAARQFDADRKDERTQLLRGKAAVASMFTMLILLLLFGVWLGVHDYIIIGLVVFGIFFIGLVIFVIMQSIWDKKM